jgi:SpoVK/Ycf46/Vps4 family AAA+-type ATPase
VAAGGVLAVGVDTKVDGVVKEAGAVSRAAGVAKDGVSRVTAEVAAPAAGEADSGEDTIPDRGTRIRDGATRQPVDMAAMASQDTTIRAATRTSGRRPAVVEAAAQREAAVDTAATRPSEFSIVFSFGQFRSL